MNRVAVNSGTVFLLTLAVFVSNFYLSASTRYDYLALAASFLGILMVREALLQEYLSFRMMIARWTFGVLGGVVAAAGIWIAAEWSGVSIESSGISVGRLEVWSGLLFGISVLVFLMQGAPESVLRPIFSTDYRIYPMLGYLSKLMLPPAIATYVFYIWFDYANSFPNHVSVFGAGIGVVLLIRESWHFARDRTLGTGSGRVRSRSSFLFEDDFENFRDWEWIGTGVVEQTNEVVHSGKYCLKKSGKGDPNGGYKLLRQEIDPQFVFSGWLYHPTERTGGAADRLAVEDKHFNGYGFCVTNSCKQMWIERRDGKKPTRIGDVLEIGLSTDAWYQFKFYVMNDGVMNLHIYDGSGAVLERLDSVRDTTHTVFDRVAVHGGAPYFVDELRVEAL